MSNDLGDMERELKKIYSNEVELSQSFNIQNIVNYYNFRSNELGKIFKGEKFLGTKNGMFCNSVNFHNYVYNIGGCIKSGYKKLRWIDCENTNNPSFLEVLIFPAINELKFYDYLKRLERLKVFL